VPANSESDGPQIWGFVVLHFSLSGDSVTDTLATIRNLQARIIYAQHDGNHAEVLRLKKELEKVK
jgi:hypothetical protein